ncbi:hypothetical protein E2C01_007592 [Portunus trituberculatus]|uniref:Uncharacterized protein n=1 Tax=Portunus trituberculatus TaxID=210409 RepID=A0A5B7D0I7_PORTR|nr:hypothetical protein [Portunus trituberculatus]
MRKDASTEGSCRAWPEVMASQRVVADPFSKSCLLRFRNSSMSIIFHIEAWRQPRGISVGIASHHWDSLLTQLQHIQLERRNTEQYTRLIMTDYDSTLQ